MTDDADREEREASDAYAEWMWQHYDPADESSCGPEYIDPAWAYLDCGCAQPHPETGSLSNSDSALGKREDRAPRELSPLTKAEYDKRMEMLWDRSTLQRSPDPLVPVMIQPTDVAQDLLDDACRLSAKTFMLYRSALLHWLRTHRDEHAQYSEAICMLKPVKHAAF